MRTSGPAVFAIVIAGVLTAGCASTRQTSGLNSRLIRPVQGSSTAPAPFDTGERPDSLETVMAKIRELSVRARPVPKQLSGATIESFDRRLAAALLAAKTFPSGVSYRLLAAEYARLGVFDHAHRHYRAALRLDPYDGAAYEGLARLWRDAGLPGLALGDAQRAVYFAPRSAVALNTLGTVFQALNQNRLARRSYERALAIEPGAAYVLNNLGYLSLVEGEMSLAIRYCQAAIAADGELSAPRHNLALVYAATGRMDLARQALLESGPPARADYNLGIINLARGETADALDAFDEACRVDPAESHACERASRLRARTAAEGGTQ